MKKLMPVLFILLLFIAIYVKVYAQENISLGKYSSMKIEKVGKLKGTLNQGMSIREMSGGVSIVLLSQEPNTPNMPIKADRMTFEWEEGRNSPVLIRMEGKVYLEHPEGKLTAEKAVWDFKKEMVEFTGNPMLDSPKAQGLKGSKIVLDFKNNTIDIENLQADMIPLQGGVGSEGGIETGLSLLTETDVIDWNGFIAELKRQGQSSEMTPGKYLLSKFDGDARSQFLS
ncbi:MAG: LptA/OstA family protein, partial [Candidatus Hydrogenedens sp.]